MSDNGEEEDMTAQAMVRLPLPGPGGYTAEDLDRMPDLPPHTELIDGGLYFVSPQVNFHMRALKLLERELDRQVPSDLIVVREMSVIIDRRNRPEPDISVVQADADAGPKQSAYPAASVVLAVEVVSPESEARDRVRKPLLYATAGIPHFWRVEDNGDGAMVIHVYELDPASGTYTITGIYHDRLTLSMPFAIDVDLRMKR